MPIAYSPDTQSWCKLEFFFFYSSSSHDMQAGHKITDCIAARTEKQTALYRNCSRGQKIRKQKFTGEVRKYRMRPLSISSAYLPRWAQCPGARMLPLPRFWGSRMALPKRHWGRSAGGLIISIRKKKRRKNWKRGRKSVQHVSYSLSSSDRSDV